MVVLDIPRPTLWPSSSHCYWEHCHWRQQHKCQCGCCSRARQWRGPSSTTGELCKLLVMLVAAGYQQTLFTWQTCSTMGPAWVRVSGQHSLIAAEWLQCSTFLGTICWWQESRVNPVIWVCMSSLWQRCLPCCRLALIPHPILHVTAAARPWKIEYGQTDYRSSCSSRMQQRDIIDCGL